MRCCGSGWAGPRGTRTSHRTAGARRNPPNAQGDSKPSVPRAASPAMKSARFLGLNPLLKGIVHEPLVCAGCSHLTMADVSAGEAPRPSTGPGYGLWPPNLLAVQYLPLERTPELLGEPLAAPSAPVSPVSQGSLVRCYQDAADRSAALAPGFVRHCPGGGARADETATRVDGKLAWVHAARTGG